MTKRKVRDLRPDLIFQVKAHSTPATFITFHVSAKDDAEARLKGIDLFLSERDKPPVFCEIKLLFRLDG